MEKNDEERYVTQIPFEVENEDDHVFIQHNGLNELSQDIDISESIDTIGGIVEEREGRSNRRNQTQNSAGSKEDVYVESFRVSNQGKVESVSENVEKDNLLEHFSSGDNDVSTNSNNNLDPGGGGSGCSTCMVQSASHCEDVDWGCVALNAGLFIASASSCAACVGTAGWAVPACGVCVGRVLATGGSFAVCDMGGQCEPEYECVPTDLYNEVDDLCD